MAKMPSENIEAGTMRAREKMIRRAYRAILRREPDPVGLAHYLRSGLGREQLERSLRQSKEFRKKSRKNNLKWPVGQIFVAKNIKVLYCPIAKNACTLLKKTMVELSDLQDKDRILEGIHGITDTEATGIQLRDLSLAEAGDLVTDDSYTRFAVLRDPVDRLLSAYWDKFVVNRVRNKGSIWHTLPVIKAVYEEDALGDPDPVRGISFRRFVDHIVTKNPRTLDVHWKPQWLYLEGVSYNRLFNIADMADVFDMLSARAGRPIEYRIDNSYRLGPEKDISGAADMLPDQLERYPVISRRSFVDSQIEQRLYDYYRQDFELLSRVPAATARDAKE